MSKRGNKALSLILSATLVFSGIMYVPGKVEAEEEGSDYGLSNPRVAYNYRDTVTFGSYWQEDTNGDGVADESDDKQPIVWQVLERYEDGTALVLSDKILAMGEYNSSEVSVTWAESTLRTWLNTEFYNNAFLETDKTAIIKSDVINDDNSEFEIKGGENTQDNVFLLSLDEIRNNAYGFAENWNDKDQSRTTGATTYAKKMGIHGWWLRSPGSYTSFAACVDDDGSVRGSGFHVDSGNCGIRPALKINLSSDSVKESERVIVSEKGTEWDTVTFGTYEGNAIRWRVLNVSGDEAFLVSDSILTTKAYDEGRTTWKDSAIRKWLNEEFINSSFSEDEQKMIKTCMVDNEKNRFYKPDKVWENTIDKVFLLSLNDIAQTGYGFYDNYWFASETRVAKDLNGEVNWWWLRTPDEESRTAKIINTEGFDSDSLFSKTGGLRPAVYIDLKSTAWKKGNKVAVGDPSEGMEIPLNEEDITAYPIEGVIEPPTPSPTSTPISTPTAQPTSQATPTAVPTTQPTSQVSPTTAPTETVTPTVAPSPAVKKDKVTTFSIKNKAKVKASAKIKIKDKDKIKKITLNGKTIKIKKNKTSFTLKLKSYKKKLKKKGKWNTLKVTDYKGNVKTIKFKIK